MPILAGTFILLLNLGAARADILPYSQDFEGLDRNDPGALAGDGWLAFGEVFDAVGTYKFGFGNGPAPNGGPAFSSIVAGEGGPSQGLQQLSIYNAYDCCDPPPRGHFNGTDLVVAHI